MLKNYSDDNVFVVIETDAGKNPRIFGDYGYTNKQQATNKTRSLGQLVKNLNLKFAYSTQTLAWAKKHGVQKNILII